MLKVQNDKDIMSYSKTLIFRCISISLFCFLQHFAFAFFLTSVAASTVCKMITCTLYENVEVEC